MLQSELAEALKGLDSSLAAAEAEHRACADEHKPADSTDVTRLAAMQLQSVQVAGMGDVQPDVLDASGSLAPLGLSTGSARADDQAMAADYAAKLSSFLVELAKLTLPQLTKCKASAKSGEKQMVLCDRMLHRHHWCVHCAGRGSVQ